jgi:hypothetical protein
MENGEEGPALLQWLNQLPDVQKTLKESFEGVPISKQNLSEWRQGGFMEWHMRNELMYHAGELSDTCFEMERSVQTSLLAGNLVTVLAAHYARLLNTWDGEPDPKFEAKLRILRGLAKDIALIQKTAHQADRQKSEFEQKERDDENRVMEEIKKKAVAPIWAGVKSRSLAKIIGGGDYGKKAADFITAVEYNLPRPSFDQEDPETVPSTEALAKEEPLAKEKVSTKAGLPRRSSRAKATLPSIALAKENPPSIALAKEGQAQSRLVKATPPPPSETLA